MQFSVGRPDLIRAINQRWLLKFWKRSFAFQSTPPSVPSCVPSHVPSWAAVEAEDLSRIAASLSFLAVTGSRVQDNDERYVICSNGATIARVYGSTDCSGKYLDEIIPPEHYAVARAVYRQPVQTGCPVYTIHDVTDASGRVVHCERLLLPFSSGGVTVDRILASFEFVCLDGAFDGDELMKIQASKPALRLLATIEPQAIA